MKKGLRIYIESDLAKSRAMRVCVPTWSRAN